MDKNKYQIIRLKMERAAEALRKNNIFAECVENCQEALELVESFLDDGMSIAVGGSVTLDEVGVLDLVRSGRYEFLDRYAEGLTNEQVNAIHRHSFSCDTYICSTNAITEDGELVNVDGRGNRVAAMIYGPESVIVVAGYNKIVKDVEAAIDRIKNIAAPANCARLGRETPCTVTGKCLDCRSEGRICSSTVTLGWQMKKYRIKVILVGEELGY